MTTLVLGWDALDAELVEQYSLGDAFGPHRRTIATFDNEALGEPHTREVWPSVITGVPPAEHGVYAVSPEGSRVEWANPLVRAAAAVGERFVPDDIRTRIGKKLRDRGAEVEERTPTYYRDRGVDTVFDGRQSRAISLPNYRTGRDSAVGVAPGRAELWAGVFEGAGGVGESVYESKVPTAELDEHLLADTGRRLGVVRSALQREYDLVFVWLGHLDTVGHLAPTVDERGWQERHYHIAAGLTRELHETLQEDDTLICVSDHGLRDGRHTHTPLLTADDPDALEGVDSVLDVRDGIEAVTPATDGRPHKRDPPVCERYRRESTVGEQSVDDVRENLEDLGYL
jgi:hypothetical protein